MAKAKVEVLNAKEVFKEIEEATNGLFHSGEFLTKIGEFMVQRIQSVTRSGKSLVTNSKLAPLAQSYIKQRQSMQKSGKVGSDFFSPGRSNLTLTGQMLDSLDYKVDEQRGSVSVQASGIRSDGKDNSKIAQYVTDQGRPFLGLDETGQKRIEQLIQEELRRIFRKL